MRYVRLQVNIQACQKSKIDTWAQARINEGWTYGEARNDEKKQTPCPVPYDELPEIEKAYDRNTAYATLKFIVKLGYESRPK